MTETIDSARFGGPGRNVEYLGTFVAWLISNKLVADTLERDYGSAIARVRMQDLTGPEFLTTVLEGEVCVLHLNDLGRQFTDFYYSSGRYQQDCDAIAYDGEDDWLRYDAVAGTITAAFRTFTGRAPAKPQRKTAKIIAFPGRKA